MKSEITIVRYPDGTDEKLLIKNATIYFPNFEGKPDDFTVAGDINFKVEIEDPEIASTLSEAGWNVSIWLNKNDPDAPPKHLLKVRIKYRNRDGSLKNPKYLPKVHMVVDGNDVLLDEDTVKNLQGCNIKHANLTITPYTWTLRGSTGLAAYLRTGYFVCESIDEWADYMAENEFSKEEMPFA